jgi:hypothetical protein
MKELRSLRELEGRTVTEVAEVYDVTECDTFFVVKCIDGAFVFCADLPEGCEISMHAKQAANLLSPGEIEAHERAEREREERERRNAEAREKEELVRLLNKYGAAYREHAQPGDTVGLATCRAALAAVLGKGEGLTNDQTPEAP